MPTFKSTFFSDYSPNDGAVNEQFADDASRVERVIQVNWDDRRAAREDFLGYAEVKTNGSGQRYISRSLPHGYEEASNRDGLPWLWARSISRTQGIAPRGKTVRGGPKFERAHLTVVYTSVAYDLFEDTEFLMRGDLGTSPDEGTLNRYVTRSYRPFARTITLPRNLLRWVLESGDSGYGGADVNKGPLVTDGIGKQESGLMLEYTHHLRPEVPLERILKACGRVNDATFDTHYPAGSLLFEPPEIVPRRSPLGDRVYDITFKFRYLPKVKADGTIVGHNHFLRNFLLQAPPPDVRGLEYRLLTTTGKSTGTRVFNTFDFKSVFRPE